MKHTFKTRSLATLAATSLLALPVLAQNTTTTNSTSGMTGGAGMNGTVMTSGTDMTMGSEMGTALQTRLSDNFDRLFMLKAAQGNMAEVMTGQLALQKSKNPQVRRVAQMLIQGHGAANRELLPLLTAKGLPLPSFVGAMHAATYDMLSKQKNARFDQTFMAAQAEAHENTITLYQQELAVGKDDDARGFATKYLPPILNHTAMIYTVAGRVKAPGSMERMTALRITMAEMNAMMGAMNMNGGMSNGGGTTGGTR